MAKSYGKSKGRKEAPGGYAGISRIVMKHPDYQNLSGNAVKLLNELAFQYTGRNNGALSPAFGLLRNRGFNSKTTVTRATKELLEARLIVQTRQGQFTNPGGVCALYALTWLRIDECPGKNLELPSTNGPWRKFSEELKKIPGPETGQGSVQNVDRQRKRDGSGRYSSVQNVVRLRSIT